MEGGQRARSLRGWPERGLNTGWIEKELSWPPGGGPGKRGGGFLPEVKEQEATFWMGRRDVVRK